MGGVTAGTETGAGTGGCIGAGGVGTVAHGVRGVGRSGGSDAPSPGEDDSGVWARAAGVATGGTGVARAGVGRAGVARTGVGCTGVFLTGVFLTGVLERAGVARMGVVERRAPETNGGGDEGRAPKASPIGSAGV